MGAALKQACARCRPRLVVAECVVKAAYATTGGDQPCEAAHQSAEVRCRDRRSRGESKPVGSCVVDGCREQRSGGITWPRSGFVSAPYDNTVVDRYVELLADIDKLEIIYVDAGNNEVDRRAMTPDERQEALEAMDRGAVRGEDAFIQQSYTIAQVRGEERDYDGRYGPDRRPEEDLALTRKRGEQGVALGVALAAWGQAGWPGDPDEAMREAYASAIRGEARWVYWWSSKWVVGAKRNRYAAKTIASLAAQASEAPSRRSA